MYTFPVTFEDARGSEAATVTYDDGWLTVTLRGVRFEGHDFDALEGPIVEGRFDYVASAAEPGVGDLTDFVLTAELPIRVRQGGKPSLMTLTAVIEVGHRERRFATRLSLGLPTGPVGSDGAAAGFEFGLVAIQRQLAPGCVLECCLSCRHAHYNPFGNADFGALTCFRAVKERTREIRDKTTLLTIWEATPGGHLFNVSENYHCREHEFVTRDDWNYSAWEVPGT